MRTAAHQFRDFAETVLQNADFCAGWIIFFEVANLIEQLRTAFVIKKLARKKFLFGREPFEDCGQKVFRFGIKIDVRNQQVVFIRFADGSTCHASFRSKAAP